MLFNSLEFAFFFIIVYALYVSLGHRWQNRMLLAASCVFYGAWSWKFLLLMFVSITTDFFCARFIHRSSNQVVRKRWLILNCIVNLGILGFFKYFNFFAENLVSLLGVFGFSVQPGLLKIVLPVGISFYTFQAMSYSFDVYRGTLVPARHFLDYALFVTFFPQLVAGPIERASHLLPQVLNPRQVTAEKFQEGCYLIFWGLFEKVVVADNLASIVDPVFSAPPPYQGVSVLLAVYAFAFQIFCDFDGYSNIARGLGRCMGFDIMVNFHLPYFATNPGAFWKRWHISLSTWLKDYLYIPLGGNRGGVRRTYRNLAVTMVLGGLWHGASWTFVAWGCYQGALLIGHRMLEPFLKRLPQNRSAFFRAVWLGVRVIFFFHLICFGWLLFRAESMAQVLQMLQGIIFSFGLSMTALRPSVDFASFVWLLLAVQFFQASRAHLMAVYRRGTLFKTVFYLVCYYLMITYGVRGEKQFIYFQF